jgi:hypothetical protein
MRTHRVDEGATFPERYVANRDADVPVASANAARVRPDAVRWARTRSATSVRSAASASRRAWASPRSMSGATP